MWGTQINKQTFFYHQLQVQRGWSFSESGKEFVSASLSFPLLTPKIEDPRLDQKNLMKDEEVLSGLTSGKADDKTNLFRMKVEPTPPPVLH